MHYLSQRGMEKLRLYPFKSVGDNMSPTIIFFLIKQLTLYLYKYIIYIVTRENSRKELRHGE